MDIINSVVNSLLSGDYGMAPVNWPAVLLGLLLAFAGGQVIAWIYMVTHSGLSYSRSFVNALIVMPVIVALVMMVLSNNLVTAFGMMAVFAIVRFRNILRDTLDTSYVLIVIVLGMAAGTQKFASAILGTAIVAIAMLYLWATSFGSRHRYDLIVNLHCAGSWTGTVRRRTWPASVRTRATKAPTCRIGCCSVTPRDRRISSPNCARW